MKIALIGDFSSLHFNLKKGFEALGHECVLYSTGDGFKKIPGGVCYGPEKPGYISLAKWLVRQPSWLERLIAENDIVQLMNPYSLRVPHRLGMKIYRKKILESIRSARTRSDACFGLSLAGCSALTIEAMGNLTRSPCAGCMKDTQTSKCVFDVGDNYEYERELYALCDRVIPFGGCAYEKSAVGLAALPMPVDCRTFPYTPNVVRKNVRILHGINRKGFKGSDWIINALNRVAKNFENVEIVIVERMPFNDYLQVVSNCNVVVDQLFGDALGMNALLSMALGRVVLTSHDRVCIRRIYGEEAPALDISSEESVYTTLAELISGWAEDDYLKIGEKSRRFVETHCDATSIARRVLGYYTAS